MPLVTRTTTAGNIIVQDAEPTDFTDGTIWIDSNDSPNTINVATGTAYTRPAIKVGTTSIDLLAAI
jgi:hypothetical protein